MSLFTGYEVERVLDPVFLLEKKDWLKIAQPRNVKGPYILCYQVQSAPLMQRLVNKIKKLTGYRTVAVLPYSTKWINTDETFYDVSPEEFLYLLEGAEIVISASFHGAALGIEFDKIVYATARDTYNARIKGVMNLFGIEDFFVQDESQIVSPDKYDKEKVAAKLSQERKISKEYLRSCLLD